MTELEECLSQNTSHKMTPTSRHKMPPSKYLVNGKILPNEVRAARVQVESNTKLLRRRNKRDCNKFAKIEFSLFIT